MGVSKSEFLASYEKHKVGGYTAWVYNHFTRNGKMSLPRLAKWAVAIMLSFFSVGFVFSIIDPEKFHSLIGWATLLYCVVLFLIWMAIRIAVWFNERAIRQVCRELGLTIQQYEGYRSLWLSQ